MNQGYGGRSNPYDMRGMPSPQYGAPYNNGPQMGRDDYATQNVEMEPLTKNPSDEFSRQDPNAILNACRDVDQGIGEIKQALQSLQSTQTSALTSANNDGAAYRALEAQNTNITALYRNLIARVKSIKQKPESGSPRNSAQVGRIDRELKKTYKDYQIAEADFRKRYAEQQARQYRIVRPDATEEEVREAVEQPNQQMFAQALVQGNRQGQATSVANAVRQRSEAIKKIESQIIELAELFQDMDNLVMQQEAAVVNIEQKGEEVVDHMDKGNEQIGVAIQSAKNTRKWKWWCLGICVLIVVIIVIVVLIYKFVIQNNGPSTTTKRFVITDMIPSQRAAAHRVISGQAWTPTTPKRAVMPSVEWTPEADGVSKAIVRKMRTFNA